MCARDRADAAVTSLIPALSCRSCQPNAPFTEFVRLLRTSIAGSAAFRSAIAPHAFWCRGANDFDRLCILETEPASQVADVAIAHGILCSIFAFGFGATEALFVPC
jgi:hypothetical protein